ncbi:dTDP-4-dehydrorhamnose reductase family protein [Sphingomonas lacusdianchii]|uniref:dTDP-4-dehydrorhamnose reductase family protein n=1 Tax=Sphingomonas lacusdianchii TaxID=2917992 RepID=UPI001F595E84|nr:SDR family oxidoreductase [Sphingomonas sp. JXJ CY 53]
MKKILVVGASGMLGFALHRSLHDQGYDVQGTVRRAAMPHFGWSHGLRYQLSVDADDIGSVRRAAQSMEAQIVINAAGVIKQVDAVKDEATLFRLNSVFPKRLEIAAERDGFKLIHFSTDCVFSGRSGNRREIDIPDAEDAYGASKLIGEVTRSALTLRTSIIGMGMQPNGSLIDWFLSQTGQVRGFPNAFFSGLPVNAIAQFIGQNLLPCRPDLHGLYHLAAAPVDKARLLSLAAARWGRDDIQIVPDEGFKIDRSLDPTSLKQVVPHDVADWPALIDDMYDFYAKLGERAL